MNVQNKTFKLVLAALFAALTTVATMFIQIPTLKGYIHLGDCFVILSGILLGPFYGACAAGIGSMLADVISGYLIFAPATLVIKALAAAFCAIVWKKLSGFSKSSILKVALSACCAAITVVAGYFVFEIFYEGFPAAVGEILPNLVQVISGIIISSLLYPALMKIPALSNNK